MLGKSWVNNAIAYVLAGAVLGWPSIMGITTQNTQWFIGQLVWLVVLLILIMAFGVSKK